MSSQNPLVAFNAHLLSGDASYRSAGISVYILNLLQRYAPNDRELRFQVFLGHGVAPEGVELPVTHTRPSTSSPWRRIAWEQTVLPILARRLGASLLHAPAFVGPLFAPCPQVITIHDLSFLRYPEFFRTGNRLYLSSLTGPACRRAGAVIAVSDFTAREVVKLLKVPEERVFRVYHGVAARFRPLPEARVAEFRRRRSLPDRFVLFLGTLEPRKNLIRLIRAFGRQNDPELHLVLAGGQGWFYEDILAEVERLGLSGRVHFPGFVSADEQVLWYNAARVFAYVSIYEGFGMPVLEALACGTPTITSASTSLPEVGGDAVVTAPAEDEAAIAEALQLLLTDEGLRHELRARGLARAAGFSWDAAARKTLDVYRWAIHRGRSA